MVIMSWFVLLLVSLLITMLQLQTLFSAALRQACRADLSEMRRDACGLESLGTACWTQHKRPHT